MTARPGQQAAAAPALRFYNPDWLSNDDLIDGFTARHSLFDFLCGELRSAPLHGSVQHVLLVGVRGSGKTTLLKRLAVAIRREHDLADHLIALSFPEELYQVKGLADLWWAACEALQQALHDAGQHAAASALAAQIEARPLQRPTDDAHDSRSLRLLLQTSAAIGRRPVMLVDNLDMVLDRVDKTGRKTKDPHSQAYWALREALSTADAPILIGGSARLSEPFVGYDKAFYDFFIPHRLGKLALAEVQQGFDHLALRHGGDELRQRIRQRPGRVQALYEMTGGNPRAMGLIFELLRQGPGSRAVDDFERLLDLTTPYYKARFEELPEQAQVVLHALALSRREPSTLGFGHTAAAIARRAGLETRTVSAQLEVLIKAGVVEKNNAAAGRTQYRIGEQLFRLWLQMRSSRRIRQQVVGLTEFLEALFDREEFDGLVNDELQGQPGPSLSAHGRARMPYALGELQPDGTSRRYLQSHAVQAQPQANEADGRFDEAFAPGDLAADLEVHKLLRDGLTDSDLELLYQERAHGRLLLAELTPQDLELRERDDVRRLVWKLICAHRIPIHSAERAQAWIDWGQQYFPDASSQDWADIAGVCRWFEQWPAVERALDLAFAKGESARGWYERAVDLDERKHKRAEAEIAYRKSSELDLSDAWPWTGLGRLLAKDPMRLDEADAAFAQALALNPGRISAMRLYAFRISRATAKVAAAMKLNDWQATQAALLALKSNAHLPSGWTADDSFILGVVATALQAGQGPTLLALLRELDFETIAAPLLMALVAAIAGDLHRLDYVEPEARMAAKSLFWRLKAART